MSEYWNLRENDGWRNWAPEIYDPDDDIIFRSGRGTYAGTEQRSLSTEPDPKLSFGIEIEAIVQPRRSLHGQTPFEALAMRMRDQYNLNVTWYKANVRGTWKNTRYDSWHVTYDSSLDANGPNEVGLEVVSPKLMAADVWERQIRLVWQAIRDLFLVKKHALSCGSHVHVAPTYRDFTLDELKLIAMFTVIHEDSILKTLHTTRENHKYCERNTKIEDTGLWHNFGRVKHGQGLSYFRQGGLRECQVAIAGITSKSELVDYMQGDNRRVLWNFRNILPGGSGTVEFRGGRHLRGPNRTIWWATFAILFVDLALRSACLNSQRYDLQYILPHLAEHDEATQTLWQQVKELARFQHMYGNLPEKYFWAAGI
ncbi:hypothetical protein DL98DRAFT_584495 [Cadophora sp. DSE1049]|nr:hypothetical protein DL98DRAFT_584495 [Cadophora sp. DSE1049]